MRKMYQTAVVAKLPLLVLVAGILAGCAGYAEVYPPGYGYPPPQTRIPEGHLPPPGECRIWYPGLEPGQQPPPGPCHVLQHQVPAGPI